MESAPNPELHELLRAIRMPSSPAPTFDVAADSEPFMTFLHWLQAAIDGGAAAPHTMTLATGGSGGPDARTVLLREVWAPKDDAEEGGAIGFATPSDSPKGRQLADDPHAAVVFYWREQHRQVRIRGTVAPAAAKVSRADFLERSVGSRAATMAGRQSDPLSGGADVRRAEAKARLASDPELVPENWTVYRLVPNAIEFWQGAPGDGQRRMLFERSEQGWAACELIP